MRSFFKLLVFLVTPWAAKCLIVWALKWNAVSNYSSCLLNWEEILGPMEWNGSSSCGWYNVMLFQSNGISCHNLSEQLDAVSKYWNFLSQFQQLNGMSLCGLSNGMLVQTIHHVYWIERKYLEQQRLLWFCQKLTPFHLEQQFKKGRILWKVVLRGSGTRIPRYTTSS